MNAKKECKEGVVQPGQPKTARINFFSVFIHLFIRIGGNSIALKVMFEFGGKSLDQGQHIF